MNSPHVIEAKTLETFTEAIFRARDISQAVASTVAKSLVLGNLKGHDSHGVIRIIDYTLWFDNGWFNPDGKLEIIRDQPGLLIVDGHFQFGQVIGAEATALALDKTKADGFCLLTIRRSSHLGRIGEFMEMAAERGIACLSLTNTNGGGVLAAPHGGCQPRLSANPIAAGAPVPGDESIVMDIATCVIAEGKLKVSRAKGEKVPAGYIVDGNGVPTTDPEDYYADPPGAILPIAAHKGYALSLFADIFAGALSGGSCSGPDTERVANNWFAIFVDPEAFCGQEFYDQQVSALTGWVKSSKPMQDFNEVMLPGEPEARILAERSAKGIPIEDATWQNICAIAHRFNVDIPE